MFSWIYSFILLVLGVLNIIYVHPIPGCLYLLLICLYAPPIDSWLRQRLGRSLPMSIKVLIAIVIIWGTLGVGDLAEMFGL